MVLTVENIEKSFSNKHVLKGIGFEAQSGKAFGLLGRNGAGKTTTIRILMNVFCADAGRVLIDGEPIDYSKIKFGYLPEERGMYAKKPIMEQLVYFAELKGMKHYDAVKSIEYWLDKLQMSEYKKKRLDTLSKGNQQKIQLITAIAHDPDIVILDEPFSGLDPVNAMLLEDVVKEEIANGKIVLFSSHQMNYIEEFCDSIAIINNGNIVITGNLEEIKRSYPKNTLNIHSLFADEILADYPNAKKVRANEIEIKLSNESKKQSVMSELSGKYDIDEIKVSLPSLNDIFVEYAGESK